MLMKKEYIVQLTEEELQKLKKIVSNGNTTMKHHKRARVLLELSEDKGTDEEIGRIAGVSRKTVARIRKKYTEGGMDKIFEKKFTPRMSRRKFDGEKEAHLIALCCSEAPEGRSGWSIRLLADKVVEMQILESVSHETIRETLKKTKLSLGKK